MKILNLVQGSEEWLKARIGVATASNFSKIITPARGDVSKTIDSYALELAVESVTQVREEGFKSAAMERGNELEPMARTFYERKKLKKVQQVGFMVSDCGNYGYSPDGLMGEDGLIEIKCPLATTHAKYLMDNKLPDDYKPQVQGGLFVSGRKWCDFISYHPNFGDKSLMIVRVERDKEYIAKLEAGIGLLVNKKEEFLKQIKGE